MNKSVTEPQQRPNPFGPADAPRHFSIRLLGGSSPRRRIAFCLLASSGLILAALFIVLNDWSPSYQGKSAREWIALADTNQTRFSESTAAFQAMGPDGVRYLGETLLRQPSALQKWLLSHHHQIPGALKPLLLRPQSPTESDTVLNLLKSLGTNAEPAVPQLIEWLENTNYANARTTVIPSTWTLQTNVVGPSNTVFVSIRTGHTSPDRYVWSASGIPFISQTQSTILVPGVVTTNLTIRVKTSTNTIPLAAFEILTNAGTAYPQVIPLLLCRTDISGSLPVFGTDLKASVIQMMPMLLRAAEAKEDRHAQMIAFSLLTLTLPESDAARELFIGILEEKPSNPFLSGIVISGLATATNDFDRVIPAALEKLDAISLSNPSMHPAIRNFGRHSPLVVPRLLKLLSDPSLASKAQLLQLLGEVGTTNTVPVDSLMPFTKHHNISIQMKAWFALAKITGETNAIMNEQRMLFEFSNNETTQLEACRGLGTLGSAAAPAVPVLTPRLRRKDDHYVTTVANTLGRIGPAATNALPELEKTRHHSNPEVRKAVKEAIRRISSEQQ